MSDLFFHPMAQLFTLTGGGLCVLILLSLLAWSVWNTTCEGIRHLKRLHQIPCDRCQYFTGEYLLKCTVHPCKAFSEEAINCMDFAPIVRSIGRTQLGCPCQKSGAKPPVAFSKTTPPRVIPTTHDSN